MAHSLSALLLADQATVSQGGLLNIAGGGWEHFTPALFPATVAGTAAGIVKFESADGGELEFRLSIVDQDGLTMDASGSIVLRSERMLAPFALPFMFVVRQPGSFAIHLSDDEGVFGAVECDVRAPTA